MELIDSKGKASEIRVSGTNEIYIYKTFEEFYGKKEKLDNNGNSIPKKSFVIEDIYYINNKGIIYQYKVWRKELENF